MKLLLDLGNTRLKACLHDSELVLLEAVQDIVSLRAWLQTNGCALSSVAIACVAPEQRYLVVVDELARHISSERIYCARYEPALLETAYDMPERLGIDRWLALLPLRDQSSAIVVDAGTAFTLDVLKHGRHIGGYILPGLSLQRDVLAQQTAAVQFARAELADISLGLNTAACVGHGSLRALVALTESVLADYPLASRKPVLTGGDAEFLAPYLPAEQRPLLVFEGLLIALHYFNEANS